MNAIPLGVFLLSLLHLGSGIFLIYQLANGWSNVEKAAMDLGMPSWSLVVSVLFLGVLAIASGVGLISGKKWGWWFASFYYAYAIARYLSALLSLPGILGAHGDPVQDVGYQVAKLSGRVLISVFFMLYLFRDTVLGHFQIELRSKGRGVLKLGGAVTIVGAIGILLF